MFSGIPVAALDFYEDLEADNSKAFWIAHKEIYDGCVRAPIVELTAELEEQFGPAKIFRPYRDVRFSKDKTPYKTAQGAVVHTAPGVGYYLQINAAGLFLGAGFYSGSAQQIAHYRAAVDDEVRGPELESIITASRKAGFELGGDALKTRPKGYDITHPRIELLRHKSVRIGKSYGCPDWLPTARTADEVRAAWEQARPLVEWFAAVTDQA